MKIEFKGLSRFKEESVSVNIAKSLTTLVGPNGAGKSTLLEALALILQFLSKGVAHYSLSELRKDLNTNRETFPVWKMASITIPLSNHVKENVNFMALFSESEEAQELKIRVETHPKIPDNLLITLIQVEAKTIELNPSTVYRSNDELPALREQMAENIATENKLQENLRTIKKSLNQARTTKKMPPVLQKEYEKKLILHKEMKKKRADIQKRINQATESEILLSDGLVISRAAFEGLLRSICPDIHYSHGALGIDLYVDKLKDELRELRAEAGGTRADSGTNLLLDELSSFLEAPVVTSGEDSRFTILVGQRDLEQMSTGTYIGLAFFSLCREISENGILFWDEPENSMHPSRRSKICDLMRSNPRRFILATHQTEFTRIFDEECSVYRLSREFNKKDEPKCSLCPATKLSDAFTITQKLGLEPARTLFTANTVIWVEGPSDVIYWRYWIRNYIRDNELDLVEGFDYCLLTYGGSLLSHYTVWDGDPAEEIPALINVIRICPACIIIADTDLDKRNVEKKLLDEYESSLDYQLIESCLKSRVKSILTASEEVNKTEGSSVKIILTYGRETENYLSDESLRAVCEKLLKLSPDNTYLDNLESDVWNRYDENITNQLLTDFPDTELFEDTGNGKALVNRTLIRNKIAYAKTYVSLNPRNEKRCNTHLEQIIEFIKIVRESYS